MSIAHAASEIWLAHAAVSLPPGTELRQLGHALERRLAPRAFVLYDVAVRRDLAFEALLVDRADRAPVALECVALHVLARDLPMLRDHLGGAELRDFLRAIALAPAFARENGSLKPSASPAVIAEEIGMRLMFCTPPAAMRSLVPLITACAAK
jgi:hypothetical protein